MLTLQQITKKIAALAAKSEAILADYHELAVSVIGHAYEHGDTTVADRLIKGMKRGMDRQAMVHYIEAHGPMNWDTKGEVFKYSKKKAGEMLFDEAFLMGDDSPKWYEFSKTTKNLSSLLDLAKDVERFVDNLPARIKKAKEAEREVKGEDILSYLETALMQYKSVKLQEQLKLVTADVSHIDAQDKAKDEDAARAENLARQAAFDEFGAVIH